MLLKEVSIHTCKIALVLLIKFWLEMHYAYSTYLTFFSPDCSSAGFEIHTSDIFLFRHYIPEVQTLQPCPNEQFWYSMKDGTNISEFLEISDRKLLLHGNGI